jgi:MFS family permease
VGLRTNLAGIDVYYGWIVALMSFLALFSIYSINFSFGVFFDFLVQDLGESRANTSLVFSLQTVSLYLSAAVVGNLVDRYSIRPLVVAGAVLLGIGMVGASQSTSLVQLLLSYGVTAGTGMGIIWVIGYTTATRWFERRRGLATAIATSGVGAATFAAPPVASLLISMHGWTTAYLLFTVAVLCGLALVALLIADDPRTLGIDASHEFEDGATDPEPDTKLATKVRETVTIARSGSFALVLVAWIGVYFPIFTLLVYLVTYTTDVGMSRWVGVWALSIMGGMTVPGRIVFGNLADRFGRVSSFVALTGVLGLSVLTLPLIRLPAALFGFSIGYGLIYGGASALVSPLIADFYGSDKVAALYGLSAPAFGVAALGGPYLAGKTYAWLGTYTPFLVGCAVVSLIGTGSIVLAGHRTGTL